MGRLIRAGVHRVGPHPVLASSGSTGRGPGRYTPLLARMRNQVSRSTPEPTTIITIINCRVENVLEPRPPLKRRDRKCPRYPRCLLLLGIMAGAVLQDQGRRDGFVPGIAREAARSKGILPTKRTRVKMTHLIRLSPGAKLGISWQNLPDRNPSSALPLPLPPSRSRRRCCRDRPPLTRPRHRRRFPRLADAASATSGWSGSARPSCGSWS